MLSFSSSFAATPFVARSGPTTDWRARRADLERFLASTPFRLDLDATPLDLSAGEKQKLEILKQLYLQRRFMILDEPTSVLTPTFRYNPAVIAQAFATMALLAPDRIMLGVGSGEALNEIATGFQGEWPEFKERWARMREAVRLMRELWDGERVTFEGDYYRTVDATIYDRPDGGVPIYVAAGGPQMAKYAGRVGDARDVDHVVLQPAVDGGLDGRQEVIGQPPRRAIHRLQ